MKFISVLLRMEEKDDRKPDILKKFAMSSLGGNDVFAVSKLFH